MLQRVSARTTVDTDSVSPDCLKAAFAVVVDTMTATTHANGLSIDWNTVEMAQNRRGDETDVVVRAGILT